jgi:hypothetical protein
MKPISAIRKLIPLTLLSIAAAHAAVILDVSSSLVIADPTQLGRLSRNGIVQDWSGTETFPGVINTSTTYHYHTYAVNVGITPFIQIEFDSLSTNTFVSAYDTAYLPNSAGGANLGFDTNWLGDAGSSGNFFGTDPIFFQVIAPINHTLLVVVSNTAAANVGLGDPFHITVEGFIDTEFDDPAVTPEPSTIFLGGGGMALLWLGKRLRRRNVSV